MWRGSVSAKREVRTLGRAPAQHPGAVTPGRAVWWPGRDGAALRAVGSGWVLGSRSVRSSGTLRLRLRLLNTLIFNTA